MSPFRKTLLLALGASLPLAGNASAQVRQVQGPPPPPAPGIQRPAVDPTHQAISALSLKLDQLRASVGRQVIVLHFTPADTGGWLDSQNSFPANNQRGEDICKQALGDRYGRVLSRTPRPVGDRWYFPHVICETVP